MIDSPEEFEEYLKGDKPMTTIAEIIGLVLFVAFVVAMYFKFKETPKPATDVAVIATPSAPIKDAEPTYTVIKPPIKLYRGKQLKQKLHLPDNLINNDQVSVLASSKVDCSDGHPKELTTTIDESTGETKTLETTLPKPWLSADLKHEVSVALGLKNGQPALRTQVKQNIFAVKDFTVSVVGTIDTTTNGTVDTFVGGQVSYQW